MAHFHIECCHLFPFERVSEHMKRFPSHTINVQSFENPLTDWWYLFECGTTFIREVPPPRPIYPAYYNCIPHSLRILVQWGLLHSHQNNSLLWWVRQNAAEPEHNKMTCPPSLIRVFAVLCMGSQEPKAYSCGQRRLWSDCAAAQAESSLGAQVLMFLSCCVSAGQS